MAVHARNAEQEASAGSMVAYGNLKSPDNSSDDDAIMGSETAHKKRSKAAADETDSNLKKAARMTRSRAKALLKNG